MELLQFHNSSSFALYLDCSTSYVDGGFVVFCCPFVNHKFGSFDLFAGLIEENKMSLSALIHTCLG